MKVGTGIAIQQTVDSTNTKISKENNSDNTILKSLTLQSNLKIDSSKLQKSDSVPSVDFKTGDVTPQTIEIATKPKHKTTGLDRTMGTVRAVANTVAITANVITLPSTVVQNATKIADFASINIVNAATKISSKLPLALQEKIFVKVTKSASSVTKITETAANIAVKLDHKPTSNVIQKKILPVANLVISGVCVYRNVRRFENASEDHDNKEMAKAGTQVVLNTISGVTGVMPGGKKQVVSAVTGIVSLASDKLIDAGFYLYDKVKK